MRRTRRLAATAVFLGLAAPLAAHDIPVDVTVQMFARPEGQAFHLLVRVPLEAMRDVNYPRWNQQFVDISRAEPLLPDAAAQWVSDFVDVYEGDVRVARPRVVAARISLPSDRSFTSYDAALARVTGPGLPNETNLVWTQGLLDVLFDYPIASDRSTFSIHPRLERLGVHVLTVLRFMPPDGPVRAFEYPGNPGLIRLDPSWRQASWQFVKLGFEHILDGTDHLLFLFCLVIPFRRMAPLIGVITSFTVAHSITLIASAYNLAPDALWFPPLVETLIAVSIVYMALENIVGGNLRRRWLITFGFGLVHGFGFSFALRQTLQFAGSHLLASLLSFNVGVELGQLLVLAVFIPVLDLAFKYIVAERMGTIILSAIVAHTAWHWMLDRAAALRQYPPPALDVVLLLTLTRVAMAVVAVVAAGWAIQSVVERRRRQSTASTR